MKIYHHKNTLLIREESVAKVVHYHTTYVFLTGALLLDNNEDIIGFYHDIDLLVYHTTKKRIIATTLVACPYQCLFRKDSKDEQEKRPAKEKKVSQFKVLKVDVENIIFGLDFLVYYDGNFHVICHRGVVEEGKFGDMCYEKEKLDFFGVKRYHVTVPFNTDKITQFALGKNHIVCDIGRGNYYVLEVGWKIKCHYMYTYFKPFSVEYFNLASNVSITENGILVRSKNKMYKYNPHSYRMEHLSNSYIMREGLVQYSSMKTGDMEIYIVDKPRTGFFEKYDIHCVAHDVCLINSRGRKWVKNKDFIVMIDGKEIVIYSTCIIFDVSFATICKINIYGLKKIDWPITHIYCLGGEIILVSKEEETIHTLSFESVIGETDRDEYEPHIEPRVYFKYVVHEISFERHVSELELDLISYDVDHDYIIPCNLGEENYLDDLINLARYFTSDKKIIITITNGILHEASGDGTTRNFIHNALIEFRERYFREDGLWPTLADMVFTLEKKELRQLGAVLSMAMCCLKGPLPIRLPLLLVEAVCTKPFTLLDLEHFAEINKPEVFQKLLPYKRNPAGFQDLQTGHTSYENALLDMCGFPTDPKFNIACQELATGFIQYYLTENMGKMNPVTMDYYLSGPYTIDRKDFYKRIDFESTHTSVFKKKIHDIIMGISEVELTQLLINWSGTSTLQKEYLVNTRKAANLNFATCSCIVTIPEIYMELPNEDLKEILISPLHVMKD